MLENTKIQQKAWYWQENSVVLIKFMSLWKSWQNYFKCTN